MLLDWIKVHAAIIATVVEELLPVVSAPLDGQSQTWYRRHADSVYLVMRRAQHPIFGTDALYLDSVGFESRMMLLNQHYPGPIFHVDDISNNSKHSTQSTNPINDYFASFDGSEKVSVQKASQDVNCDSASTSTMAEYYKLLDDLVSPDFPCNALDLRANKWLDRHKAFGITDCNILQDLEHEMTSPTSAARGRTTRWTNRKEWVLIGRGGLTSPHTDSHGLGTFLTVVQGCVGFLWWSRPSEEDMHWWAQDVYRNTNRGKWCYVIMKAGETVYFPPLTVHAVFRSRSKSAEATFITGGHILRYSSVGIWAEACAFQLETKNRCVTNEDMKDVTDWVWTVAQMVARSFGSDPFALTNEREQTKWGKWVSAENLQRFWVAAEVSLFRNNACFPSY